MKLKKLLEISGTSFTTKRTSYNPVTGKIGWNVEYHPDFSQILKNLDVLTKALDNTIKDHAIKDQEILTSLKGLKAIKSVMLKTLETKYPEYIKDYLK